MNIEEKVVLIVMSRVLDYPERNFFEERLSIEELVNENIEDADIRETILKGLEPLYQMSLEALQEVYVETFDYKEMANLYLTAHELGDSKKRGMALIKLQKLIIESGFEYEGKELADYIPMLLELSAFAPESENIISLKNRIAYAVYRIQKALPESHPYFNPVALLTKYVFKSPNAEEIALLEHEREKADQDELPYPLMYQ
ncbi:nitrate reductase molybdenum cofactor assembly chaperone [Neobacillus kokaensis]|uniref:Nitrate reductase molybdenum cofactor assembly chaperone n=1 Tax=Neobacillus kokaensis TaxID=2759023 RepID=A0ABQ3N412_9BACI|nr:nitrate reductase molybdenum cofactor assembly chaperone [Neobacillus kokaensis]GHH98377.1 hypothetical protein AM1BK_19200 [Neobacillus kokaensis]